jgi:hypothetical protein
MRSLRDLTLAIALIGLTYLVSYVALSLGGRYEAMIHSAEGPTWYTWVPAGFSFDLSYGRGMQALYYPLHHLDCCIWHVELPAYEFERTAAHGDSN